MARVSRKTYAALMTAKDDMNAIRKMTQDALELTKELKVTNAYRTAQAASEALKAIAEIAESYITDFSDVDPKWKPPATNEVAPAEIEKEL